MRYLIRVVVGVHLLCCMQSCIPLHNYGYPEKVSFSKNGGEKIISGDSSLMYIIIAYPNGGCDMVYSRHDSEFHYLKFDWLTVTHQTDTKEVTLIAEPNRTRKKRKLIIKCPSYVPTVDITVVQDK